MAFRWTNLSPTSNQNTHTPAPVPKETIEDFITAKEVSIILGISLVTLHKWKKDGKLKFHRFGSRIRFKKSEILNTDFMI